LPDRPGLRFAEDFEQYGSDAKIPLALGAAAYASLGDMADQVFQLFAHDIILIRWLRNSGRA